MNYTASQIQEAIAASKAQGFSDADIATGLRLRGVTQEQAAAALAPATTTVAPAATTTTAATTTAPAATTTATTTASTTAPAASTATAAAASTAAATAPQSVQAQIAASLGVPVGSVAIRYGTKIIAGRESDIEVQDTDNIIGYAVKNNDELGSLFDPAGNTTGYYIPKNPSSMGEHFLDSLEGPQGPAGATGATGATGPQGPQGEPGTPGASDALGTGFTDGGGAGTIPDGTVAEIGNNSLRFGYTSTFITDIADAVGTYSGAQNFELTGFNDGADGQYGHFFSGKLDDNEAKITYDAYGLKVEASADLFATINTMYVTGGEFTMSSAADMDISAVGRVLLTNALVNPVSYTNSAAPSNTIFYSTTDSKLSYKDPGGTVHGLY